MKEHHTPGPWGHAVGSGGVGTIYLNMGVATKYPKTMSVTGCSRADAILISAAPDLLEACERCIAALVANAAPNCEAAKEARAAVDKAKGVNNGSRLASN